MQMTAGSAPISGRSMSFVVVTSIRRPTPELAAFVSQPGWHTIFVADRSTPEFDPPSGMRRLSVRDQMESRDRLAAQLPWRHYSRKNLGYACAIREGARVIFDTDDDNAPLAPWTPAPAAGVPWLEPDTRSPWVNVYAHFGGHRAWPRGYPLERIGGCEPPTTRVATAADVVVWQGLVSGDADVDAVFRLTREDGVTFHDAAPLALPEGTYCPFNSQNTWWRAEAFPYLYLPSTVPFRFTDILRGIVAQRCFWAHGWRLGFQGVTATQRRNEHDLLADFRDEIPAYLHVAEIADRLLSLTLTPNASANLRACYATLADREWVRREELAILDAWLERFDPRATNDTATE